VPRYLDDGEWLPLHRRAAAHLPRDRAYSEVEAMVSLSLDLQRGEAKPVREYARIWRWSRDKVKAFLVRAEAPGHERANAAESMNFTSGQQSASDRPEEFKYVAPLRRSVGQQSASDRPLLLILETETKKKSGRAKPRPPKRPWNGKAKDLDALLAERTYLAHLAEQSTVLASWTLDEIAAWCRHVVAKGNRRRAERKSAPITSFVHFLTQCVSRVQAYERPRLDASPAVTASVTAAAEGMGL
jgi:hypothetical protein